MPGISLHSCARLIRMISCLGCLAVPSPVAWSADLPDIIADLASSIESSQAALSRLQSEIADERRAIAQDLNAAQNRVEKLRADVVANRRLADEATLSLEQLEERLQTWQEQSLFQTRLLLSFYNQTNTGNTPLDISSNELGNGVAWLQRYLADQNDFKALWRVQNVVMSDGEITQAELLQLGPVEWFVQPELGQGGLISREAGLAKASYLFSGQPLRDLMGLHRTQAGSITFDPTLSQALLIEVERETLLQHLQKGGIWVIPILLAALFASFIAIGKAVSLYRLPKLLPALGSRVEKIAASGSPEYARLQKQLQGAQAELFNICLQTGSPALRDDRLFAFLLDYKNKLDSWLGAIAVTAAVAPLLGLLGTVSGMITTFKLMTLFGAGDPSLVSGGISEALITTELGLIVAIPALLGHSIMLRRVKDYYGQLEANAVELSQLELKRTAA